MKKINKHSKAYISPLSMVCWILLLSLLSVQFQRSFLNWYSHSTRPCLVPKGTDSTVSGHLVQTFFCCSIKPLSAKQTPGMMESPGGWSFCIRLRSRGEVPSRPIVLKPLDVLKFSLLLFILNSFLWEKDVIMDFIVSIYICWTIEDPTVFSFNCGFVEQNGIVDKLDNLHAKFWIFLIIRLRFDPT